MPEKKIDISTLPRIIAIDFDGTLVENDFPNIGKKNFRVFDDALMYKRLGLKLILWTCRTGQYLNEAVEYCKHQGLEFDAINRNIPEVIEMFGEDTRKVYANVYVDDRGEKP